MKTRSPSESTQCLCKSFTRVVKVSLEGTCQDQGGATATFPAHRLMAPRKKTLPLVPTTWFTPQPRSLQTVKLSTKRDCRGVNVNAGRNVHPCERRKERDLGSLRLKKKVDINLFSAKPLGAVSQEAVFGASLLLRAEKWDFLCELCTSKT